MAMLRGDGLLTMTSPHPLHRPRLVAAAFAITGLSVVAAPVPLQAQDRVPIEAVRAIIGARSYAVELNGGLGRYRPAQCMFATAARCNPCLILDDDGFVFRFAGGPPGWEDRDDAPTVETELRVSDDGRTVEEVLYNGSPR